MVALSVGELVKSTNFGFSVFITTGGVDDGVVIGGGTVLDKIGWSSGKATIKNQTYVNPNLLNS